jgi:hypothetical protein
MNFIMLKWRERDCCFESESDVEYCASVGYHYKVKVFKSEQSDSHWKSQVLLTVSNFPQQILSSCTSTGLTLQNAVDNVARMLDIYKESLP